MFRIERRWPGSAATGIWFQPLDGKIPCKAMMNVMQRYGGMLLWGRLPPVNPVPCAFIGTLEAPEGA